MGNFRTERRDGRGMDRDRGSSRGGFGGSRFGRGRGRFGDRGAGGFGERGGRFERRPLEMHDVTCDKCGKETQVPFKPSGDKPVLCRDCFEQNKGPGFGSRSPGRASQSGAGMPSEQFSKINAKLDKIITLLEDESDEEEDLDDNSEEDLESN